MASEAVLLSKLKNRKIKNEPNWMTGNLGKYSSKVATRTEAGDDGLVPLPVQQSDMLKPIYMDIVRFGLNYAYKKYQQQPWVRAAKVVDPCEEYKYTKTDKPKDVIIIGAGMAGLSAAYELAQVGHKVQILEMQERVGGRVKTFTEKDGFAKHLYIEGLIIFSLD